MQHYDGHIPFHSHTGYQAPCLSLAVTENKVELCTFIIEVFKDCFRVKLKNMTPVRRVNLRYHFLIPFFIFLLNTNYQLSIVRKVSRTVIAKSELKNVVYVESSEDLLKYSQMTAIVVEFRFRNSGLSKAITSLYPILKPTFYIG
jgi:hypothetical protein